MDNEPTSAPTMATRFVLSYARPQNLVGALRDVGRFSQAQAWPSWPRIIHYSPCCISLDVSQPTILVVDVPMETAPLPIIRRPDFMASLRCAGLGYSVACMQMADSAIMVTEMDTESRATPTMQFHVLKDRVQTKNHHRTLLWKYMELTQDAEHMPFSEPVFFINATGNPANDLPPDMPGGDYVTRVYQINDTVTTKD